MTKIDCKNCLSFSIAHFKIGRMKFQTLRASADAADPFLFVASSEGLNRKNLILDQSGWVLGGFKRNPIALWNHDQGSPIGTWENLEIKGNQMMARLKLAVRGTSELVDTIWSLVEQKILKAASVGFMPLDYDIQKDGSIKVKKMELREISLVSVPADANALRVIASASEDVRDSILFGAPRRRPGEPAKNQRNTSMNLADRIRAADAEFTGLQEKITELSDKDDLTEEEVSELETLSSQAEDVGRRLNSMRRAEAALALSSKQAKPGGGKATTPAQVRKDRAPAELLFRSAYVIAKSHVTNRSLSEIILGDFGGDKELEAVTLAASNPAMTGVAGWAAELVETQIGEFLTLLAPESVWAKVVGLRVTFDRAGAIRLPGRTTRSLGGNFVGEGAPIPVKQATLTSILVSPFKMAVITTMTRELAQRSSPAAEPLFRQMMIEDTAVAIDAAFMDNGAASAVRPAGLQVLGTGSAATGTGDVGDVITDLRAMVTSMMNAGAGRRPVWIMGEGTRIGLSLKTSTSEDTFPFQAEIARGTLLGYPVITSITVPTGLVFLLDQAELAQGYGDSPAIDMSNQATLHMEDTTPLAIGTTGTPTVVAAPTRSLFQTDSLGLRLVWDITWNLRRPGAAQFRTGVAW